MVLKLEEGFICEKIISTKYIYFQFLDELLSKNPPEDEYDNHRFIQLAYFTGDKSVKVEFEELVDEKKESYIINN